MKVFLRIRVLATLFLQRKSSLRRGLPFLASDAAAIRELFKRTNGLAKFDNRAPCETRLLQETQGGILHQLLRVGAAVVGNPGKPRFLLRRRVRPVDEIFSVN